MKDPGDERDERHAEQEQYARLTERDLRAEEQEALPEGVASEPKTTSSIPAAEIMFASAQPRNRPTDVYGKKTGSTHSASEIRNCRLP